MAEEVEHSAHVSFFGFGGVEKTYVDDVNWVEIKIMNEGDRRRYQSKTTRDMKVSQGGEATFSLSPGEDRQALLEVAIKDWNFVDQGGNEVTFNRANLEKFLDSAPIEIVDKIDNEVRNLNPWLNSEQSIEDMQNEIDRLEERIKSAREEAEGKE